MWSMRQCFNTLPTPGIETSNLFSNEEKRPSPAAGRYKGLLEEYLNVWLTYR
jgi:hypothetical protein